jgi:predicted metal-dependent TIM-barrel fold hydrolase
MIIEPHIHILSRTTDDLQAMYENGIRVCVEPSFWLGSPRRYAGTFWDYFQHILDFETVRARRFGMDHYACIAVNPKEADNLPLAEETLAGIGPYFDHPRCLAVGEIGYNLITANEEHVFQRQLELAKARKMLIVIHTPHDTPTVSKKKGVERTIAVCRELNYDWDPHPD